MKKSIWRSLSLLTAMLFVLCSNTWSQELTVTGTVSDGESGEPLPGVNVVIVGTQTGTITNIDGFYEISVPSANAVLNFTFVGYNSESMEVAGKTVIDLQLVPDIQALDEVVVVGYGTMRRKDLTGSVASVQQKDIDANRTTDALGILQGKVAGLDVTQSSGQSGAGVNLTLRGRRSINAGNAPLIIVDGVEYGQTYFEDGREKNLPLDINSSIIESMDILKDAASTAIYGTRGANGVIIITTKKGGTGKVRVSYNGWASYNSPTFLMDIQDGAQYSQKYIDKAIADEENGLYYNQDIIYDLASGEVSYDPVAYPEPTNMFGSLSEEDVIARRSVNNRWELITNDPIAVQRMEDGISLDYLDMIMVDSWSQNHELSITGGDEVTAFNLSFGFMDDNGLLRKDNFKRYNVKVGVDHKFGNWLKVGADLLYTNRYQFKRNSGVFNQITKCGPIGELYEADGVTYRVKPDGIMEYNQNNPLLDEVDGQYINDVFENRLFGTGYLNFFILEGLTFRSSLGVDMNLYKEGRFQGSRSLNKITTGEPQTDIINDQRSKLTWDNVLNYNKTFGSIHNLTAMIGSSAYINKWDHYDMRGYGQPVEATEYYDYNGITKMEGESDYEKWQMLSFFGRLNYSLMDRYLFQATIRADGASVLNENNRWASFPSASVGWRLSEEEFMKGIGLIQNLKLRYSWGIAGNAAVRPYKSLTVLGDIPNYYSFGTETASQYVPFQAGNKDLGWEKTQSHNFGLDFSILNYRISGSVEYYMSNTSDLLFEVPLPSTSGFPIILANVAEVENNGIEFSITTVNIKKKNFVWSTDWIFAHNKNKVLKLREGVDELVHQNVSGTGFDKSSASMIYKVGSPVNSWYTYDVTGIYSVADLQAEIDYVAQQNAAGDSIERGRIPMISNKFYPGNIKLADQNNDGKFNEDDKIVKNAEPKYVFSLVNNFELKTKVGDFGLDILAVGRVGQTISYGISERYKTATDWVNGPYFEPWTPTNTGAEYPRWSSYGNAILSTYTEPLRYIEASYIKIQDITLSYTLPKAWLNTIKVERLRVYVSMRNWNKLIFSNVENYDPEINGTIDFPLRQQVFMGVNLDF